MYLDIRSLGSCVELQNDINAVHRWCMVSGVNINVNKCKILKVTRSSHSYMYGKENNWRKIQIVEEIKDLGVMTDYEISGLKSFGYNAAQKVV